MKNFFEDLRKDKKKLYTSGIALLLLIVMLIASTYAFFKSTDASDEDIPLQVTTNTTDSLVFNVSNDITFTASPANFNKGMGNQEGETKATATLKANNKTNGATEHYYLYLDVTKNELKYTTEEKTAELILQVTGPDGLLNAGDIAGLNYVTVTDGLGEQVSGFDITEAKSLITIASNKEITTTSEKTDNWDIKVILVNLESDQKENGGKRFNGSVVISNEIQNEFGGTLYTIEKYYYDDFWSKKEQIKKVVFESRIKKHINAEVFDISQNGDKSVLAYLEKNDDDYYSVYIQSNGKVRANSDSSRLFDGFESLEIIEGLENFDTSQATDMSHLFQHCNNIKNLDLSSFDTSEVTDMTSMFAGCSSLTNLDLSNWVTSQATDMSFMFYGCNSLTNLSLNSFDTSKVTDISYMFNGCSGLTNLDLSSFDTSQVQYMRDMFSGCSGLINLDLRRATFTSDTSYLNMFTSVPSTIEVTVKDDDAKTFIEARLAEANGGTVIIA